MDPTWLLMDSHSPPLGTVLLTACGEIHELAGTRCGVSYSKSGERNY